MHNVNTCKYTEYINMYIVKFINIFFYYIWI